MINGVHCTFKVHVPMEFLGGDVVIHIPEDVAIIPSTVKIGGEDVVTARIVSSSIRGYA